MNGIGKKRTPCMVGPDLSGQRFGSLVVTGPAPFGKDRNRKWFTKCDCGVDTVSFGNGLRNGRTTHCGCKTIENRVLGFKRVRDERTLIGSQFGALTVLAEANGRRNNGSIVWECMCRCGASVYATTSQLKRSLFISCGCVNPKGSPLSSARLSIGERTGSLVVEEILVGPNGGKTVLARCDCGGTKKYKSFSYPTSKKVDCGCGICRPKRGKRDGYTELDRTVKNLSTMYRGRAIDRGLSWELSPKDVSKIVVQDCLYCGAPPVKRVHPNMPFPVNGIDRVDNKIGYTVENSAPCCSVCNRLKSDFAFDDFLAWVRRVAIHTGVCK